MKTPAPAEAVHQSPSKFFFITQEISYETYQTAYFDVSHHSYLCPAHERAGADATCHYKSEPETVRHIGVTAQDFRAAFGFGENDKTLSTVDANGVTMAAIQGLYQQNQELIRQVEQLRSRVTKFQRVVKKQRVRRR